MTYYFVTTTKYRFEFELLSRAYDILHFYNDILSRFNDLVSRKYD